MSASEWEDIDSLQGLANLFEKTAETALEEVQVGLRRLKESGGQTRILRARDGSNAGHHRRTPFDAQTGHDSSEHPPGEVRRIGEPGSGSEDIPSTRATVG